MLKLTYVNIWGDIKILEVTDEGGNMEKACKQLWFFSLPEHTLGSNASLLDSELSRSELPRQRQNKKLEYLKKTILGIDLMVAMLGGHDNSCLP